jgi:signal transduction histidine kinase/FixJ family two-component response regulator
MGPLMQWEFLEVLSPSAALVTPRGLPRKDETTSIGMRLWGKKTEGGSRGCNVARAALAGASRRELLREALKSLTQDQHPDRVGIWLEPDASTEPAKELSGAFHGLVWDRALSDTPPEWRNLSVEPPLPDELGSAGRPVEQEFAPSSAKAVIGQLVGLRRALWIPVATRSQVKGLILLGSSGKPLASFHERAESVAAQLALALELQDQLRFNLTRKTDLALVRHLLETLPGAPSSESLLSNLAGGCVQHATDGDGPGASFAMVGVLQDFVKGSGLPGQVDFRWRSGDEAWTRAMEKEPLAMVWRRALDTRQVIGSDPPVTWPQPSVARIVAFPLEAQGQLLGVLVAGLPGGATSLATLDRMELRARLAAVALHDRKRQEQESQRALSQQELLDLVSDPVLLLDDAGKITGTTRGARKLLQRPGQAAGSLSPSISSSLHLSDIFADHDRIRLQKWLQQSLDASASGDTWDAEKETPQAELQNGLSVRLRLAPRVPGQPAAILLQPTPALESGRQPEHAEAELHNVLEWLEEGVVLFDSRENVRAMNTRFEQIAGLSPEEAGEIKTLEGLIARLAGQAAEPAHFAERWRVLAREIESGVREELQMVRPAPRILERAARPVLDPVGRQLGRVEIYRDLTAQRVFHSKLLQTEKLAALGQMVSGVAHELSSPLTSILGYAQRLLTRQDTAGHFEGAQQIYQEAERASAILRQLLLNARETLPERRLVSLNQVVMRAVELQRFGLAAEKIRVEIDLDPALPFIHADPGQLQQVLINLLSNARQALEEQGPGGAIRLRTRRAGQRRVLLEVEDNGPGIPQAIQARIFDPFFTTKPAGVGTGLGLSIVLSVLREHGGQVYVQSPPQGGTRFQIEIPAASERQMEDPLSTISRETSISLPEPGLAPLPNAPIRRSGPLESKKGARVLVVEDEPTVARLIADVLEDEGMRVDILLDGREALELAVRRTYELIICDMKMPGLDGQHFYKSLERTANQLRDRFLFVTGDVMGAHTREFLERHRLPHVAKPFRVEELMEKVHAVLHMHEQPEPSPAGVSRKNAARNG